MIATASEGSECSGQYSSSHPTLGKLKRTHITVNADIATVLSATEDEDKGERLDLKECFGSERAGHVLLLVTAINRWETNGKKWGWAWGERPSEKRSVDTTGSAVLIGARVQGGFSSVGKERERDGQAEIDDRKRQPPSG